jgi:hypothetical protein
MALDPSTSAGDPAPTLCPRCGGVSLPRRRQPNRLNPFLGQSPPAGQVTCEDCGLDFELATPSAKGPWSEKTEKK